MKKIFLFLLITVISQPLLAQKKLTVYVVRHAEKLIDNPKERDPDLSTEGKDRAISLQKYLSNKNIDSIFSTDYKRTRLTGFPSAEERGLPITIYNFAKQKELATNLKENADEHNILVIGHSNTILDFVRDLGARITLKELNDEDYDYIFIVTIKKGKASLKVGHYGKRHRLEK